MSYIGSDDGALCDGPCNRMFPPGWPDWIEPWPVRGPLWDADGRLSADRRDNFHLCLDCLRELILKARLRLDERALALRSKTRWEASQRLLDEAEAVVRGPRAPGRLAG
jgi:hypothetical protein